jgi:glycosyltransferase involved in cell wall biosynthesis
MKILWMSDSPTAPSGFGNVSRFVCSGLAERGHDVSIVGWQARGRPEPWQGCTLYPTRFDTFGADVLLGYLQRIRPDVLVTLADVWWLTFIANPTITGFLRAAGIPWALYYPIDGDLGGSRLPQSWIHVLERVDVPIAMSEYGRDVSLANGVEPAYVPHGVDTTLFRPSVDRWTAKRRLGYEGRFVVLCDARNQPRKLLPRLLDAFRRFARDRDDVVLHLHCDPADPAARTPEYCYDVAADVELLGLGDRVRFTKGMSISAGIAIDELAAIYQAADVHLLASWGEGFGLPTLQAAAAGAVPMAVDYTASAELVRGHGEAIRPAGFAPDRFGIRRALIDVDDAAQRLERLYTDRDLLAGKAAAARRFAEAYDWSRLLPRWTEILEEEVPAARRRMSGVPATFRLTADVHGMRLDGAPPTAGRDLRAAISLPDGASAVVKVVASEAGRLAAEVINDSTAVATDVLTIPVTLPPSDSVVRSRQTGCLHVASPADAPLVWVLAAVFPGITLWSGSPIDLGPSPFTGEPVRPTVVDTGSPAWRRQLAVSVLVVDMAGAAPELPAQAAELGVPSIGLASVADQRVLWPDLALSSPDVPTAARVARDLLTDPLRASASVAAARQRWTELRPALAPSPPPDAAIPVGGVA